MIFRRNSSIFFISDTPEWAWDKIFEVNVKNTFQLIQEAVPYLEETQGNITCVASIAGFQPINMIGAYSVSKTAMIGLVKALSFELAHRDIRINTVCPGIVKTKFAGAITESVENADQFAMQRFAEPREISGVISFLSDNERASYVTGEAYNVCGGGNFRL